MDFKTCTKCNEEFPKNSKYFFKKKIKQLNSKGELKIYNSFRSNCIKCHGEKSNERRIKKRCKEMGCDVSDYRENWKKQYSKTRTVNLYAKSKLTKGQYNHFLILQKQGFINSYDEYIAHVQKSKRKRDNFLRKQASLNQLYFTKEDLKNAKIKYSRKNTENLIDSYITHNSFGLKVNEVPKEVIETKRLLIKLKREIRNGN